MVGISLSYLDIFPEFYKATIVQNIACIWCCDKSSLLIGKL